MALNQELRIPNLPTGAMTDKDGMPTNDELVFRQNLVTSLQNNFGSEGLIAPTQTNAAAPDNFIKQIQDFQLPNGQYTCGFGRFLYDATNNRMLVSIDGGAGVPAFMEITLAAPVPPV
jgi:hypothetical protein